MKELQLLKSNPKDPKFDQVGIYIILCCDDSITYHTTSQNSIS